jgi:hypothetical protein
VSIQKLHQDEIRDEVYDARVSKLIFVRVVLYDPENGEEVGVLLAVIAYYLENYMQGVLLVGNPIQTILHMSIGSPFVGYSA